MFNSAALPITRRCFVATASLASAVPPTAVALLTTAAAAAAAAADATAATPRAATRPVDAGRDSADGPDLPSATLLNAGEAPAYLLVFHTGQRVMKGLLAFATKHELVAGHVSGIGALSGAEIGFFDPETNAYLHNQQNEQAELLSLTGNLALSDDAPFFHIHVALGLRDGSARGGHLFEATARPTVELVLTTSPRPERRKIDRETHLPLLDP
jgi:predicted DNA-binding protein with PD1-like motif